MKRFSLLLFAYASITIAYSQEFDRPTQVFPLNELNSPFRETNIALTADGLVMYFTSLRGGNWWNQLLDTFGGRPVYDSDIYMSTRTDTASPWNLPVCLPPPINDELNQDEVHISPDGQLLTYQCWSYDWKKDGGPYYEVRCLSASTWSVPQPVSNQVTKFLVENKFNATDGMCRMRDGSIIFAAGPTYDSPMDLFILKRLNGRWATTVEPLTEINTPYDERSVFIAADKITLYFASKRPSTGALGGLDIYHCAIREQGGSGEISRLESPINSSEDDYSFVIHQPLSDAYFIRSGDIMRVKALALDVAPSLLVTNRETKPPVVSISMPSQSRPYPVPAPNGAVRFQKYNNIVLLLDKSNSMDDSSKLPMVLQNVLLLTTYLRQYDKLSLITFDTIPNLIFQNIDGDQTGFFEENMLRIRAGGNTRGKKALELAFKVAKDLHMSDGNNVVLLATDGQMDLKNMDKLAGTASKTGTRLFIFSYGKLDNALAEGLDKIALKGNGWRQSVDRQNIWQKLLEVFGAVQN